MHQKPEIFLQSGEKCRRSLTLLVLGPEYSAATWSIPWWLMTRLPRVYRTSFIMNWELYTHIPIDGDLWRFAQSDRATQWFWGVFSCDQAAIWMVQSARLSVCPSVRHTFLTMFPSSYHHEIFRSYYQWQKWWPCKRSRSKVKVTEVMTPLGRFWTVTPVWIHILRWNDAYSLMLIRRGALLFFKVSRQISRSHG